MREACSAMTVEETQLLPDRKKPSGRPMHPWEDNMKMDLTETGYRGC